MLMQTQEFEDLQQKTEILYGASNGAEFPLTLTDHASTMAAHAGGKTMGVVTTANLTSTYAAITSPSYGDGVPQAEKHLESLSLIMDDVIRKGARGKAVINMSLGFGTQDDDEMPLPEMVRRAVVELFELLDQLGVVLVVASGNDADSSGAEIGHLPAVLAESEIPNMIVVGASNYYGVRYEFRQFEPWITTHAPGEWVSSIMDGKVVANSISGTSFGEWLPWGTPLTEAVVYKTDTSFIE
jgi:hypothetical protein